ncbi:30S ribosomal protein S12 methylthiotransferase RimO [Prolixibacteraceae bacterium Z1-6]|uniref:Ribosomal protein uS12 methylthiotransferase RimO n=1 Tax=Draconibacterium aestuarii TaxID=2998507 RepID=A0A9X3FDE6_9BACT|nr:30S ribosomal protein S12 methylthiotransferase RimO [Prolixibacteraceae bacterium Z1-6]
MAKKRVNVVTMGCSKNLVDSEVLLNQLERGKFEVVHDSNETGFDAVFVNTCGFIHDAKQESIEMILDYAEAKKRGEIDKLYVMGCLSERYQNDLERELPEVDKFFGKFDMKAMVDELKVTYHPEYIYERKITTASHFAYLKISEGCNRSCSFCAIPKMTGRHKSRTIESLVKETRYLAKKGVKELLLIAQDLSYYGIDLYGKSQLAELINQISEVEGIEWIRLHYLYPTKFPMDILPIMRENPKVCKYLDLPLQHISNPVLKNMLRHVTREETEALLARIKEEVPGVVIRTTMLVGFPGETEADFEELKEFIQETKFERLGVFPYSKEEGTYAGDKFNDKLSDEEKQERADEIMEIQQYISAELNQQKIGKEFQVIIDNTEGEFIVGRTEFDSPEVDGEVLISTEKELRKGQMVTVKITGAEDYDLYAELV